MPIGIIGAMAAEVEGLISLLDQPQITSIAGLNFYCGKLVNHQVVVVQCGVGKVNAAMCAQLLIDHFHVSAIINTGVAGGVDPQVAIGDVVISQTAIHHDFDTTNFGYPPGTVPGLATSHFPADPQLQKAALQAAYSVVGQVRTHIGTIVSGDQFIASEERKDYLYHTFRGMCAEMEGAAIAHVAYLNQIPFVIIRIISDQADTTAPADFNTFLQQIIPDLNQIVCHTIENYSDCSSR